MFNKYYDKIVVLSQAERKDRRKDFERHTDRINLHYEYFDALPKSTPRDSFNHSHYEILKRFNKSGLQKILVLEDDCRFKSLNFINDIHQDANTRRIGALYYGINARPYPEHIEPTYVSDWLRRVYCGYTTHAIGYTKETVEFILRHYNPDTGTMYDAWLSEQLGKLSAMVTVPFIAIQAPSHSDLWNRSVDYTDTFKASEEYLKSIQ